MKKNYLLNFLIVVV